MTQQPTAAGELLMFGDDPSKQLSAFISNPQHSRAFVALGGQTDGFFSHHSMRQLVTELGKQEFTTVQVQLASSRIGFGGRTHVGDAEDLGDLMRILERRFGMHEVTLFAWSTGVQVALELLSGGCGGRMGLVTRVVLQGVVNDPNEAVFLPATVAKREDAVRSLLAQGVRDAVLPSDLYDIPITASRLSEGGLPSLQEALWQPAVSGDLDRLRKNLSEIRVPLMFLVASSTSYTPTREVQGAVKEVVAACASTPEVELNFFPSAGDERRRMLAGSESEHTAAIAVFLKQCDERRQQRENEARTAAADESRKSRSILARSTLRQLA